jgi:hypothetical protein
VHAPHPSGPGGPSGANPHVPRLPAGVEGGGFLWLRLLLTQSRRVIVSFGMSSEALGNKRRSPTPDVVANASDPHSENTSGTDACLRDVQEGYCGEEESEVDDALETGGGEGEGVTRGQDSGMPENLQKDLGTQEMNPFKTGSPTQSHIGGCRKTFPFAVAESPKIGEGGGEVSELNGHQGAE